MPQPCEVLSAAHQTTVARRLLCAAQVQAWELCYVQEWVTYHLSAGGPNTRIYLLPLGLGR